MAEKYDLIQMGEQALTAKYEASLLTTEQKNTVLTEIAQNLRKECGSILTANAEDVREGIQAGMSQGLLDRLKLTEERISQIAEGLVQITKLPDPVGNVLEKFTRPNGLVISKVSVPMGVIGIIYESRPNVTADAFGLCFKAGNVVILKGGSDALHSNIAITNVIRETLEKNRLNPDMIQLITATDRAVTAEFMKMKGYVDVLIPRGGAGLIKAVVENATIPVIETGTGNCHIYIDKDADIEKAVKIIVNAKTQRIGVCNACESLVVHSKIAGEFIPQLVDRLKLKNVEIRGDERAIAADSRIVPATEDDWGTEYLDYIISLKVVDSIDEAIAHINRYNTGHSEAIITKDYDHAQQFLNEIDAAAVYVNASTRFTDGFEFGFGAEIGISTQKIHARGPMGLDALTTSKYVIYGNGQVRK
jgi:glutamate-5-semialdehyde dehydrogenase